jgi:phosphoribosylamine-glycine ligase
LEGEDVKVWIKKESCKRTFDGIIKKIPNWESGVDKDTIIFIDHCKLHGIGEKLRANGNWVINGSKYADDIELDRQMGQDVMDKAGIKTPPHQEFKDFPSAITFIRKNKDKRFVFKPSGNLELDWTYIGADAEDLIERIQNKFSKEWPSGKPVIFVLQEFIKGIEISTEVWHNKNGIINANGTMEEKKLLTGGIGPSIGCAGNVVWNYDGEPKILKKTLSKLKDVLSKERYVGCLDINCIVAEKDDEPYGIEWTARPGYDALQAWIRTFKKPIGETLYNIATGNGKVEVDDSFATAVRIEIPPFPFDTAEKREGDPIVIDPKVMANGNYWFFDVYMKNKQLFCLGTDGIICIVTDKAATIQRSIERCYKNIEEIKSPRDIMYRVDIGERVKKEYKILHDCGLF